MHKIPDIELIFNIRILQFEELLQALAALMLQLELAYSKKVLKEILMDRASWTFADYLDSP